MVTRGQGSRRGQSRARTLPRRKTSWIDTLLTGTIANAAQFRSSLLADVTPNDAIGYTLTRLLVHLWLTTDVAAGAYIKAGVDVGIGLVTQEAFAAGIVPDPAVESERPIMDWVYRDRFLLVANNDTTVLQPPIEVRLDLRSRRKIGNGELFIIIQNSSVNTGFTVRHHGLIRSLFLLP